MTAYAIYYGRLAASGFAATCRTFPDWEYLNQSEYSDTERRRAEEDLRAFIASEAAFSWYLVADHARNGSVAMAETVGPVVA